MSQEVKVDIVAQVKGDIQGQINKAKGSLDQLKTSTDKWAQSNQKATVEANKAATNMSKVGTASQGAASKVKSFGSSMSGLAIGLATAAQGIVNMSRAYRDLEDTQLRVTGATNRLDSLEKSLRAKKLANKNLLEKENYDREKYRIGLEEERILENKIAKQKLEVGEALEAQSDAYQDFYLQIIPTSLGTLGTLGMALSSIKANSAGVAGGFSQMSTGSKLLKIGLTALPLVAIAAAFLAIRTNAFGVRDSLDQLGARIGSAVPQLVPFLNWVKDLATALGLTGQALDLSKAWQLFVDGFKTAVNALMTTNWSAVLQTLVNNIIAWVQQPTNWILLGQAIIKAFETAIVWTKENIAPWLEGMVDKAIDWMKDKKNWEKLGERIKKSIGDAIKWVKENVWPILQPFVDKAVEWAKDPKNWEKTGTAITNSISAAITTASATVDWDAVWKGFQDAMFSTGVWINEGVVKIAELIKANITVDKAKEWWIGFWQAISEGAAEIINSGLAVIGQNIAKEIKTNATNELWWKGMWDAMSASLTWIAGGISAIGKEIAKEIITKGPGWWEGFRIALGKSVEWVGTEIAKIGAAIVKWFQDNATDLGTKIWNAIWGAVGKAAGGLLNLIPGIGSAGAAGPEGGQNMISTEDYFKNKDQILGGGGATGGLPAGMDQAAVKALHQAWSTFSSSFATYVTSMTGNLTKLQTAFSTFSTSISTYVTSMKTNLTTFFTTTGTQITTLTPQLTTLGTAFTTLSTTVTTAMTAMNTQIGVMATTTKTQFATLATAVTTSITTMNTQVGVFATTTTTQFNAMSTSVTQSLTKMTTQVGVFATTLKSQTTPISQSTTSISGSFLAMSSSIVSSLQKAISEMSKFVSSLKSVASQAAAAKKDVDALAKSINALKDKSITVHVGLSGPGVGYLQHGGSFIAAGQHGYSGIVDTPTTFKGVRMGESFRPELVTVTPLTRGTGNHSGPTVQSGRGMGGGGSVTINNIITLDGRQIAQFVRKVALDQVGMQI